MNKRVDRIDPSTTPDGACDKISAEENLGPKAGRRIAQNRRGDDTYTRRCAISASYNFFCFFAEIMQFFSRWTSVSTLVAVATEVGNWRVSLLRLARIYS